MKQVLAVCLSLTSTQFSLQSSRTMIGICSEITFKNVFVDAGSTDTVIITINEISAKGAASLPLSSSIYAFQFSRRKYSC